MAKDSSTRDFSRQRIMVAIRRRLPLIIASALIAAIAAFALSASQTDKYTAEASLLFRDPGFDQRLFGAAALGANTDPAREAATNVRLVSLDRVAELTAEEIGGSFEAEDVSNAVDVEPQGQSDVVAILATDEDPALAATLANAFASNYIRFRREADRQKIEQARRLVERDVARLTEPERTGEAGQALQQQISRLKALAALQTGNAELVQVADEPSSPSSPKVMRNTIFGGIVGLLIGASLALLLERLDRRVRTQEEFEEVLGLPVLAAVPEDDRLSGGIGTEELGGRSLESFRMLRTRLRYFNVDRDVRSVVVTSTSASEGKTTVSWHLAASMAAAGAKAIIVEADLHRPTVSSRTGVAPLPGLSELLSNQASYESALQTIQLPKDDRSADANLDVITSGAIPPNPVALLESREMHALLERLTSEYDLVVFDTPPLARVADAIPLVALASGVVLVGRLNTTTKDDLSRLRNQLDTLDASILGLVINRVPAQDHLAYYGYHDDARTGLFGMRLRRNSGD